MEGMKVLVYLRDTRDGYARAIEYLVNAPFSDFWWTEGSMACDCNRTLLLYQNDEAKDLPCNLWDNVIALDKIVRADDGALLYVREDDDDSPVG